MWTDPSSHFWIHFVSQKRRHQISDLRNKSSLKSKNLCPKLHVGYTFVWSSQGPRSACKLSNSPGLLWRGRHRVCILQSTCEQVPSQRFQVATEDDWTNLLGPGRFNLGVLSPSNQSEGSCRSVGANQEARFQPEPQLFLFLIKLVCGLHFSSDPNFRLLVFSVLTCEQTNQSCSKCVFCFFYFKISINSYHNARRSGWENIETKGSFYLKKPASFQKYVASNLAYHTF